MIHKVDFNREVDFLRNAAWLMESNHLDAHSYDDTLIEAMEESLDIVNKLLKRATKEKLRASQLELG